ncbi:hypothetical protein OHA46_32335 [Streptomyces sp. NBC_00708]
MKSKIAVWAAAARLGQAEVPSTSRVMVEKIYSASAGPRALLGNFPSKKIHAMMEKNEGAEPHAAEQR